MTPNPPERQPSKFVDTSYDHWVFIDPPEEDEPILSTDAHGHQHKGKGPGGGQFTSGSGGGNQDKSLRSGSEPRKHRIKNADYAGRATDVLTNILDTFDMPKLKRVVKSVIYKGIATFTERDAKMMAESLEKDLENLDEAMQRKAPGDRTTSELAVREIGDYLEGIIDELEAVDKRPEKKRSYALGRIEIQRQIAEAQKQIDEYFK